MNVRFLVKSIYFICKEKRLLLRRAKDFWMRTEPEIEATGSTFWCATYNYVWKQRFHLKICC